MKNEITITIEGPTASGKSRLLYLLKNFLKANQFQIDHNVNIDFTDESEFDKHCANNFIECIAAIKDKTVIKLQEKQSPRVINNMEVHSYDLMADGTIEPRGLIKE